MTLVVDGWGPHAEDARSTVRQNRHRHRHSRRLGLQHHLFPDQKKKRFLLLNLLTMLMVKGRVLLLLLKRNLAVSSLLTLTDQL